MPRPLFNPLAQYPKTPTAAGIGSSQPGSQAGSIIRDGSSSDNGLPHSARTDFNGTDTFTYTASDGNGGTDIATVTISIIAAPPESLIYFPILLK